MTIVDEMSKHGITKSSSDVFHVDGFRYSNLADAVAQAKRTRPDVAAGAGSDWRNW